MLYFGYGSNMWQQRMYARIGMCRVVTSAWVEGYALRFHKRGRDGSGKCDAHRTDLASDRLYGVVFEVEPAQRERLDAIEGLDYVPTSVVVRSETDEMRGYAYVAKPTAIDAVLRPFEWYKSIVVAGACQNALPESYIKSIECVGSVMDSDAARVAENLSILAAS